MPGMFDQMTPQMMMAMMQRQGGMGGAPGGGMSQMGGGMMPPAPPPPPQIQVQHQPMQGGQILQPPPPPQDPMAAQGGGMNSGLSSPMGGGMDMSGLSKIMDMIRGNNGQLGNGGGPPTTGPMAGMSQGNWQGLGHIPGLERQGLMQMLGGLFGK